jgi:replicative DNA helicase
MSNPPSTLPRIARLGDLLGEWEVDAIAAHDALVNGSPRGPATGFPRLDRELGGAFQPGLHYIHGSPGTGKTALSLQIAATCGTPAVFVSCEMSPLELFRRHTARVTGTYLGRLKSGELTPADSLALARQAAAAAPYLTLVDATRSFAAPEWLRQVGQVARGEGRHVLIVIDSIHSWAEASPIATTEYESLNAGIAGLRGLAHALSAPVLCIAEQNRASMGRDVLSAGAGSRKIEYGAESVISLTAEEGGNVIGQTTVIAKFAKNRHGAPGRSVGLTFNGALQSFSGGQ